MNQSMTIFRPGHKVMVGEKIEATVICAEIYPDERVVYRCAWWNDNCLEERSLPACMVNSWSEASQVKIGFAEMKELKTAQLERSFPGHS